ncbi:MAG TPA: hypothetical protein VIT88_12720 [Pyrinomonadaceae bacterium]
MFRFLEEDWEDWMAAEGVNHQTSFGQYGLEPEAVATGYLGLQNEIKFRIFKVRLAKMTRSLPLPVLIRSAILSLCAS